MPIPRYETLAGAINGTNTVFLTVAPYKAVSTAVFVDGLLLETGSWTETNPSAGIVTLGTAPLTGSYVQIFYIDTSPALPEEVLTGLTGVLQALDASVLQGQLSSQTTLVGIIE